MKLTKKSFHIQKRELDYVTDDGIPQYKYCIHKIVGQVVKTQNHKFGIFRDDCPKDHRLKVEYVCYDLNTGFEIIRRPRKLTILQEIENNEEWVTNYDRIQNADWYRRVISGFEHEIRKSS